MLILSFDVGIKNLAYCLFEYNPVTSESSNNKNNYEMLKWDIIDLANTSVPNCQYKDCKYKAKYVKQKSYYCKTHAKKHELFILPNESLKISKIKKMNLSKLRQIAEDYNLLLQMKSRKKLDYLEGILHYIETHCFEPIQKKNTNNFNLVSLGIIMKKKFEELFETYKFDVILIENQISPIANRMKCLQGMITQYFIMKDCENIQYVSSANKLKGFSKERMNYKQRKEFSIKICIELLQTNKNIEKWTEFFLKHKKKDDLADCFLQGLWYINNKLS
tara:strand:- start:85 stop:912 length:828 start_codon:yes stop_codon:yes gene_type:complete